MVNYQNINTFSMRQIPFYEKSEDNIEDSSIDKIKILDLSNSVDKWEKELLFSDNGFYSLKGLDANEKLSEFEKELEDFINLKISQISFSDVSMSKVALEIRDNKIDAVKKEMKRYAQEQLRNWELQVFEDALSSCVTRAVLYKFDNKIIESSLNNGVQVIIAMADKEDWNSKVKVNKLKNFKQSFYTELINAFVNDKDINASVYFEKYKNFLNEEAKQKLENSIKELRENIIAYNYAKELFSYNLTDFEREKEISAVKDKNLERLIKNYLNDFKTFEIKQKEEDEKSKNSDNWQTIINLEEFDKAFLHIDYSLKSESIKAKKNYIEKIKKYGFIKTDCSVFLKLFTELFEDFDKFKETDLSDNHYCLSLEDFALLKDYQNLSLDKYTILSSDFKYLQQGIKELGLNKDEDIYTFVKLTIYSLNLYKEINKKEADLEARNKIFEAISKRFQTPKHDEKKEHHFNSENKNNEKIKEKE